MNFIGLVAAVATFFSIWFGHVAVRKVEFISPTIWMPTVIFAIAGITLEWFSLSTSNFLLSAAFGILGITLLWDALEFTRQQNRIKKGHSPANPQNPRHARLMREYPAVTNLDLLKRDPLGKPVSPSEAIKLIH
ncbi:MAG: DUF4491 family protein [Chloroflexi bacterium]|nr:MAG: DUF4491 family protein [Chloroflexota bacterium]